MFQPNFLLFFFWSGGNLLIREKHLSILIYVWAMKQEVCSLKVTHPIRVDVIVVASILKEGIDIPTCKLVNNRDWHKLNNENCLFFLLATLKSPLKLWFPWKKVSKKSCDYAFRQKKKDSSMGQVFYFFFWKSFCLKKKMKFKSNT